LAKHKPQFLLLCSDNAFCLRSGSVLEFRKYLINKPALSLQSGQPHGALGACGCQQERKKKKKGAYMTHRATLWWPPLGETLCGSVRIIRGNGKQIPTPFQEIFEFRPQQAFCFRFAGVATVRFQFSHHLCSARVEALQV
jgi:hypothetical protein